MKKCEGCGVKLQTLDAKLPGYVRNDSFGFCQRCFRLIHYGEVKHLKKDLKTNEEIFNFCKENKNDSLIVLVLDIFEAMCVADDGLLDYFSDYRLLVVINKVDLFPRNIREDKINNIYAKILSKYKDYPNINFIITYKRDLNFNNLFFDILKENNLKKTVFVGRTNAGKSSIINKLCENQVLTVSIYPGTTYGIVENKIEDYLLYDSPGLIDEESVLTYLENEKIKSVLPLNTIKSQIFQFYEEQTYFIEGMFRMDVFGAGSAQFMIHNNLEVHRTKLKNADLYFSRHVENFNLKILPLNAHKYQIRNNAVFVIKGLGLIKIRGYLSVKLWTNDKIKIYEEEVDI